MHSIVYVLTLFYLRRHKPTFSESMASFALYTCLIVIIFLQYDFPEVESHSIPSQSMHIFHFDDRIDIINFDIFILLSLIHIFFSSPQKNIHE